MTRSLLASKAAASVVVAAVVFSAAQAQDTIRKQPSIKNFGCVNSNYFRGAQPEGQAYRDLAALGVKTVIDLQRDGEADEKELVEAAGMKFVRLRMSDRSSPSTDQTGEFLKLVGDPANQPVFVHCKGGRHRTGVMTAIYRVTHDGWSAEKAYQEMKEYEFNRGFGHGSLKDFLFSYCSNMDRTRPVASAAAGPAGSK